MGKEARIAVREFDRSDRPAALAALAALAAAAVFRDEEVSVAAGVVDDALADREGYLLLAGEVDGQVRGFVCAGSTPLTASTWHLYWICVHPEAERRGLGRALQARLEELVRERGGRRIVVETSGRADYARARRFYAAAGYSAVGRIADFYADADDCILYAKHL